jgi:hypothetical protein
MLQIMLRIVQKYLFLKQSLRKEEIQILFRIKIFEDKSNVSDKNR